MPKKKRSRVQAVEDSSRFEEITPDPEPNHISIELENVVPKDSPERIRAVRSSSIEEKLPSRDKDAFLELRPPDFDRHGSRSSAFETMRAKKIAPKIFIDLPEDRVLELLNMDPDLKDKDIEDHEKIQNDNLREYHYHLTAKREVRAKLKRKTGSSLKARRKSIGCLTQMKYSISMKWKHTKAGFKELLSGLELWQKPLRIIEGNFGSSVASYFYFLRRLFRLNCLIFTIMVLFVVIPQLLLHYVPGAQNRTVNLTCPEALNKTNITNYVQAEFSAEMILTGGGWFERTEMYYGYYTSRIISLTDGVYYNMPLAYLLTVGCTMLIVMIFVAYLLAKSYKEQYIEHSGLPTNFFFNKVFCGWDFAIINANAANNHKSSIRKDLKEQLSELKENTSNRNFGEKLISGLLFLVFNSLALLLLAGTGWLMYFLLDSNNLHTDIRLLGELSISLVVALVSVVVPAILTFMIDYEGYKSHNVKLFITTIRLLALVMVILGILLAFWIDTNSKDAEKIRAQSWETEVGKELYRLVLMDFIIYDVLYFFVFWLISIIFKKKEKFRSHLEFNVALQTWNLLYNQMLCWLGCFFCPLLPLIMIIKMIFRFYIKQCSVRCHSKPPERAWRAQRAHTIFLGLTFLAVISSFIGLGIVIIRVKPSQLFGPFKPFYTSSPYRIIFCVSNSITDAKLFGQLAEFVVQPGCVAVVVVVLCCIAYSTQAMAAANLKTMKLLRKQVTLEGQDKTFLLSTIKKLLDSNAKFSAGKRNPLASPTRVAEAANYDMDQSPKYLVRSIHEDSPSSPLSKGNPCDKDRRASVDSEGSRREFFAKNRSVPVEHRLIAENSPSDSRRRRQGSVPRDSESDYQNQELNPYRSQDNLTQFPFPPTFRESESPYKSNTPPVGSPYRDNYLPGVNHQPPFQNLGKQENPKSKKRVVR